ncbi:MAG: ABC transporter permease, partial [Gemmatimonadetes bacterium]|nr:ABC transporter permease [Gemmatimonadota bacterium]
MTPSWRRGRTASCGWPADASSPTSAGANLRFALTLAYREGRAAWRRAGPFVAAIAMGVAAVVAIDSARRSFGASLESEARTLLGADLRLESNRTFPEPVTALLDSVAAGGNRVSRITRFASMVLAERSARSRLLQVRAVSGPYPLYGNVETDPAGRWATLGDGPHALVDPAMLIQLDAAVGDTLAIGAARFVIHGTVANLPTELGFQAAIGPRVFIPGAYLDETELIQVGSLVRYEAYLEIPQRDSLAAFLDRYDALLEVNQVDDDTAEEQVGRMTRAFGTFTRFLGLVGLTALLLGGIGVASAVRAFVRERLTTVAVLRCIGATRRTVLTAYLLQAGVLGLLGALAGVLLGLLLLLPMPRLLAGVLPQGVRIAPEPVALLLGLGTGVWVAGVFALLPLLSIRDVTPLQALRRDVQASRKGPDLLQYLALGAVAATIVVLAIWHAPATEIGLTFAASILGLTGVLALTALGLAHAARRAFPAGAAYVVRQGIANLFRPSNHTVAVTLALGIGVFLVATLDVVQRNLVARFSVEADAERPNVLLFDLQRDQLEGTLGLFTQRGYAVKSVTPIVPARIAGVNGRSVEDLLASDTGLRPRGWTLRREYRNTYRDTLVATEELVAGSWTTGRGTESEGARDGVARISLEEEVAGDLRVGIGDRITWDVQGVPVESEVTSIRRVDWAQFEPNFFVVFKPGALEKAPQSFVALARVSDAEERAT